MTAYVHRYEIEGEAAEGRRWKIEGELVTPVRDFMSTLEAIMRNGFEKLRGNAVYGHPEVGCRGPYHVNSLSITVREERA